MAKIVAAENQELTGVSGSGGTAKGIFYNVFISGVKRGPQRAGCLHCLNPGKDLTSKEDPSTKFLLFNKDEVYFILMFVKKIRCKREKVAGKDYERMTYFCWDPSQDEKYPEGSKIEYIFAGALVDIDDNGKIKSIPDPDEPDRNVFVYMRNNGTKCGKAFEFIDTIREKTSELEPLSDGDDEFESTVITPRRFITKITVDTVENATYNSVINVYNYELFKQLPDEMVIDIVERSKKWLPKFKEQFDCTSQIKSSDSNSDTGQGNRPTFEDEAGEEHDVEAEVAEDFSLPGI